MVIIRILLDYYKDRTSICDSTICVRWIEVLLCTETEVMYTVYVPFFLASNYVPDMAPAKRKRFLMILWGAVAVLLAVLIPSGVI